MNTDQARRYLTPKGQKLISKRTLQRYAERGLLTVEYIDHEGTRSVADYKEEELQALKEKLEKKEQPGEEAALSSALMKADPRTQQLVSLLTRSMTGALKKALPRELANPTAPLATLPILTPAQAATVSGLTEHFLRQHLDELKAKKLGRGYKIRRTHLDAFVNKLFKEGKKRR
jgi:hypothetical protein